MKNFLLLIVPCFLCLPVKAEITVGYTDSNVVLNTSGNLFGTNPEVVIHDDFEGGTHAEPLSGWSLFSSHGKVPVYSNADVMTGNLSGKADFTDGNFNSTAEYKSLGGLTKVYVSYYFKVSLLSGVPSRNIKLGRLSSGYKTAYVEPTGLTFFPVNANGIFYTYSAIEGDSKAPTTWLNDLVDNNWHRAEYLLELSNPAGAANGMTRITLDGKSIANHADIITEELGNKIEWFTLPYYVAHDPGGSYHIFYDNVVVSKNQARVEVCDKDTYSACKKPTLIQISSWESNKITIAQNKFLKGAGSNLYVFNQNGELLNANGIHACPKCPKPPIIQ